LLIALMLFGAGSQAQDRAFVEPSADLKWLRTLRVTVTQTTPDAASCGLKVGSYIKTLEDSFSAGGLGIETTPSTLAVLSVMTKLNQESQLCGSAVMLGIYRLISFFDETTGSLEQGYVVLWQQGQQVFSPGLAHPEMTNTAIVQLAEKVIADWMVANGRTQTE